MRLKMTWPITRVPTIAIAMALTVGQTLAADLPSRKGPPPVYAPPPVFNWTGFYVGVNVGYGFGNGDPEIGGQQYYANLNSLNAQGLALGGPSWNLPTNLSGVLGGGQVGYNYQFSPWLVLGIEADIQGSGLSSSSQAAIPASVLLFPQPPGGWPGWPEVGVVNTAHSVDWFGTVRGRIGVTPFSPNLLLYGTAGLAYGHVRQNFGFASVFPAVPAWGFAGSFAAGNASFDDTKVGWTAGGGVEWAPASFPSWSAKIEYLYTDLGATTLSAFGSGFGANGTSGRVNAATNTSQTRWHTVRAGLNYHFSWGGAPIVARY